MESSVSQPINRKRLGNLGRSILLTAAIPAAAQAVVFSIDPTADKIAISPLIYGGNQSPYSNSNYTFDRLGGNRWTAYNWTTNASNAGSDYFYQNDTYLGGGTTPAGAVTPFVAANSNAGRGVIVTVPMAGYVSADVNGPVDTSIRPENSNRFVPIFPNAAADPSPGSGHVYQDGFVTTVKNAFNGSSGRPLVFMLDNEPDLWAESHKEVHPDKVTYSELVTKSVAYSKMIKATAPTALVYGPASYGWDGYTTLQGAPDAAVHGDFINYYLGQMSSASTTAGTRLLDALDLHWYPEARDASGATRVTANDASAAVVAARLQAPRSLWDPTYVENSYISSPGGENVGAIRLIPRMQGKIAANYPGTKLSISEYNYGDGNRISGGVAEADVLGVFGKFGVYSANEWPLLGTEAFINGAMRMFRNTDGNNAGFGDTSVRALNSDTVNSSVYAATDAANPCRLTIVLINKQTTAQTATINISNGANYTIATAYQLTIAGANPQAATAPSLTNPAALAYNMPAMSVTTLTLLSNQWLLSTGGSWSNAASWSAGIPEGPTAVANFLAFPAGLTAPGTVTLDATHTVGRINFSNANRCTIAPGVYGKLIVTDSIAVAVGGHTIAAPLQLSSGTSISTALGSSLTIAGNVTGVAGPLTVSGALTFSPPTRSVLAASSLNLTGQLNLIGGDLVLSTGSVASLSTAVAGGSITTAAGLTIGVVPNDVAGPPLFSADRLFDGYAPAAMDVLLKPTYFGDANLDGKIDGSDYSLIDAGYTSHSTGWYPGDFNYDGSIDGSDYTLIDNAYNRQGAALTPTALVAAVPEPMSVMVVVGALALRRTRLSR